MNEGCSSKSASDVINGEYKNCHSLVSAEAKAVNEVSVTPPREIILSPHAKATEAIYKRFMKIRNMLEFGPSLEFRSFFIIPKGGRDEVCQQWVQVYYWNSSTKKKRVTEPQTYESFVKGLMLADELHTLCARVEGELEQKRKRALKRSNLAANSISPLASNESILASLDAGEVTQEQLEAMALQQYTDIKHVRKREVKVADKKQADS